MVSFNVFSHESEVTVLVISGHFLFSACAAGHLKIWLLRGYSGNPLMLQNIKVSLLFIKLNTLITFFVLSLHCGCLTLAIKSSCIFLS